MPRSVFPSRPRTSRPRKYKDTYTDALLSVIKRKQKGEEIHAAPAVGGDEEATRS